MIDIQTRCLPELAKGETAIGQIDWIAESPDVSAAARPAFEEALGKLAQAMRAAGGRYRLDLYMMQLYDDAGLTCTGRGGWPPCSNCSPLAESRRSSRARSNATRTRGSRWYA